MIYEALYSPNLGLVAFRCRCGDCTRVVRTERGITMHCWRKHKIKLQMEMAYGEAEVSIKHEPVRNPVRIVSSCFGGGAKAREAELFDGDELDINGRKRVKTNKLETY